MHLPLHNSDATHLLFNIYIKEIEFEFLLTGSVTKKMKITDSLDGSSTFKLNKKKKKKN